MEKRRVCGAIEIYAYKKGTGKIISRPVPFLPFHFLNIHWLFKEIEVCAVLTPFSIFRKPEFMVA